MTLPSRLLIATDFSEPAARAGAAAIAWAQRLGGTLDWVHALELPLTVIGPYSATVPQSILAAARDEIRKRLAEAHAQARKSGVTGGTHMGESPPASCIADQAEAIHADLTVVGTHGYRGLRRLALGSVAEKVVKLSPCSVLTVKGDRGSAPPERIVVGVDFSDSSEQAVRLATELAALCGASLHLVHAVEPYLIQMTYDVPLPAGYLEDLHRQAAETLDAEVAKLDAAIPTKGSISQLSPHRALSSIAGEGQADLVVTGSHGRTGISHALLGSVAERVLRSAPCSVWTVRNP